MAELDPELRDKIIETHTLVKRMDMEHQEHKNNMNGRLKGLNEKVEYHRDETKNMFDKHDARIQRQEHFRTRIIGYITAVAGIGTVIFQFVIIGVKKLGGL